MLARVLGEPVPLKPRGSQRARRVAFGAAVMGVLCLAAGLVMELVPAIVLGCIALTFGSACYSVLGMKVSAAARRS
jgi:hypothetical protein